MNELDTSAWTTNWMWSLPIIIVTSLFHTFCLGLLNRRVTRILSNVGTYHVSELVAMRVMGIAVLSVTLLHAAEAATWASSFRLVGGLRNTKLAMLYSLSAMTAYGHANLYLDPQWQLMGALEALNGLILFGLTTAFLFTVTQKVWPHVTRG